MKEQIIYSMISGYHNTSIIALRQAETQEKRARRESAISESTQSKTYFYFFEKRVLYIPNMEKLTVTY